MMSLPVDSAVLDALIETNVEELTFSNTTPITPPATPSTMKGISRPETPRSQVLDIPVKPENPYAKPIHLLNANLTFTPYEKEWKLSAEEQALVSASVSKTWTDQAMKCYMCAADCANCDIPKGNYSFVCQMAKVVPVLLESLGQPDPHRLKRIFPQGYPHTAY
jgi:hypothetical protein